MSKIAEQRALEAYPVKEEWIGNQYGTLGDVNETSREKYQEGYEQAEKDLELTTQDIIEISKIIIDLENECADGKSTFNKSNDFYIEVLKRFKEWKEDNGI